MNKSVFIIVVFIITIPLPGCVNTTGKLDIKGKVLDEKTRVLLPGRIIIVQGLVESDHKAVAVDAGQFSTDSSGHFSYTIRKVKDAYFYHFILVGDSAYAFSVKKLGLYDMKRNAGFLSFHMPKLTDFTITIEKISRIPLHDTLYLSWRTDEKDGISLYPWKIENYGNPPDLRFRWIGGDVKSVIRTKVYADKKATVSLDLIRNGKKQEVKQTVFCIRDNENKVNFSY